jgi:outer membrane protein OmpA-like peptidoglycan-associated protein
MTKTPASTFSAPICRRHVVAGMAGLLLVRFAGRAAMAEPQSFSIYFDKQSSELLPSAKGILIVIKPLMKPNTRTTIVGHADTSESNPDELSLARANAIVAMLENLNMPAGAVLLPSGKGTSELRMPTAPNVPEPVNRYVSITIQ